MVQHAQDIYGSEGSVPTAQPSGLGAPQIGAHATPEDFGAQVGQAVQKVGQSAEEQSVKYATMAMETAQNTAEVGFIKDAGDLKAKYMQYEGSQAENMRPQYEAEMQALQTKWGQGLPLAAQHQYNLNTLKSLRYSTTDYAGYAAGQTKQANMDSGRAQVNIGAWMANDPSVAVDDRRFGEQALAPIAHGNQIQIDADHIGLKTDPNTGTVSFDESKLEGQNLKAQYEANLNHTIGVAYENRFKTLASTIGPVAAYDKLQKDKDEIPPASVVRLEASLQPQVMNAHANDGVNAVMAAAQQGHQQALINPSSAGSSANNLGNVKTAQGAANNTQQFINPVTPVDGAILTANNLRSKNYQGKTLAQIGHTWTSTDPDNWVKNVSATSGINPNTVPDLNDPKQLSALLKGIATAEKSPEDRKLFTDDVIAQGVQGALAGKQPQAAAGNAKPSAPTLADYASTHRQYLYQKGDEYSEATMPGSIQFRNMIRERVSQQISTSIEDQRSQYNQNNHNINRAFNGEFTQGKKPTTWAQMEAIPGLSDAINFSNERTPEFIRALDTRLTARANGAGDEHKYGDEYMDMLKNIHPTDGSAPTITTSNQLYDAYYNGKITDAGRAKLQNELESVKKDPAGAATVAAKASLYDSVHKQMSFQDVTDKKNPNYDPIGEARFAEAIPLMDQQLEKNREAKIPDYKSFDPQDKDFVGNAVKPLMRTDAQKMVDKRAAALHAANLNQGDDMVLVSKIKGQLSSGALKGDSGSEAIRSAFHSGKMSRETALSLGKQYGYVATSPDVMPQIPKPE